MAITVNDVLDAVADATHVAAGRAGLQPFWPGMATRALAWAQRDVLSALGALGLTTTQIATWSGYDAAVSQQALFWSLVQGGATLPTPPDQQDIQALDLREQLPDMVLTDALGNVIRADPSSGIVGQGVIKGGWADTVNRDPERRQGFVDPGTGRFRQW